jgi:hypothetical protein
MGIPELFCPAMSANELLERVKSLTPRERRRFFAGVHELEEVFSPAPPLHSKKMVRWPDAAARRRRILGDKVVSNLILLTREQEPY